MPDRNDLDKRYAAATASAAAAEAAHEAAFAQASAAHLQRLRRQSVKQRFDVLADANVQLTDADRRALVQSIRGTNRPQPSAALKTATWLDIWRSRLRYRRFAVGTGAVAIVVSITLAAMAEHHTPVQWVQVVGSYRINVTRADPAGQTVQTSISPGRFYAAVGYSGSDVQLRDWEPGYGYATFWVPRSVLVQNNPS